MGYTHYWTFKVPKGIKVATLEAKYQKALLECAKVAIKYNQECKDSGFEYDRLSGYTAHTKPGQYGGLQINGKEDNAHEPFELREHFKENMEQFNFCKTARKPYDTVVVACLAILKYRLGDAINVSSDGDPADWINGVQLARHILKRKVPNPMGNSIEVQRDEFNTKLNRRLGLNKK